MHLNSIKIAHENIKDIIVKTPLLFSSYFSDLSNNQIYMKCENLQITGAYKIRGALNKLRNLNDFEKERGVVCSSAGNHAQGVAYASLLLGIKSTIVMPKTTPYLKVESTKNFGGSVVLEGKVYDDAYNYAKFLEEKYEYTFIHPFNDMDIIYGQGTIALEILNDIPNIDIIICPIGGGGLISGVSLAAKSINPNIKVIGVQASGAPSMFNSFKNGKITSLDNVNTIADGIAVKTPGDKTFEIIKDFVDDIILVDENEIVETFLSLSEKHKLLAEGAGLVSLAALKKLNYKNKKIACIISGGNIDVLTINSLLNSGLVTKGRLCCITFELPNRPGELLAISEILARENANVVKLEHNQFKADNKVNNVLLEVTVETNGKDHINQIINTLKTSGYNPCRMY